MADSFEQMKQFYRALERLQKEESARYRMAEKAAEAAGTAFQIDKSSAAAMSIERMRQQEWSRLHAMDRFAEAAAKAYERFAAPMRAMEEKRDAWMQAIHGPSERFEAQIRAIEEQADAFRQAISESFQELPKQLRKVMEYMFERGWYVGPDMTLPGTKYLARLVDQGNHEKIEEEIQEWAEGRLDELLASVKKEVPARLSIIGDALGAHRNGKYTLSVPVLLAQADGIAHEGLNTFLFMGNPPKNFKKFIATLEPLDPDSTLGILVSPLRSYSALGKKAGLRVPGSMTGHSSRHEVLHGTDTAYATKGNSLRAVLLVNYLLNIKGMLDAHKESAKEWRKELDALALAGKGSGAAETSSAEGKAEKG